MDKETVIDIFNRIGFLLELKGENPFKVRAYYNGARTLEMLDQDVGTLLSEDKLGEVPGIGKALEDKISELYRTGKLEFYEKLRASVPETLFELEKVPGLGPKKIKTLYQDLSVVSLGALEQACLENRLLDVPGFGLKTQEKILKGIEYIRKFQGQFLYTDALADAQSLLSCLLEHPEVTRGSIAGSLRRHKEIIGDGDLLVGTEEPAMVAEHFSQASLVEEVLEKGDTKTSIRTRNGLRVDLRMVADEQFPYALHHFTGSKEHNTAMRHRAKEMGIKMNEYGLFQEEAQLIPCRDETDIFNALGLSYIPPELRENLGEIEGAERNEIPVLAEEKDIRGVLHVHSQYSDGLASIRQLADECRRMGYSYLGISDHSQSAYYAGGLRRDDILRQHDEIDVLNAGYTDFTILKGIECDIRQNGDLDYDESMLKAFDFVIASVHSHFHLSREDMTARILKAMDNPYTTILGHPTGRLLLTRKEYELDVEAVLRKAARQKVAVEINANPHRLDLDWRWCRRAKELGVLLSVNPDAHDLVGLDCMSVGVGIARKGWLTAKDIVNALSLPDFLAFSRGRKNGNG